MLQPASPIIVRVADPPAEELGLGQVILGALGLTGVIWALAIALGLVLGAAFIYLRFRRPHNQFNGENAGDLSLKLE